LDAQSPRVGGLPGAGGNGSTLLESCQVGEEAWPTMGKRGTPPCPAQGQTRSLQHLLQPASG